MSMYVPGIKEELSEEAKMLVEDGGKVYRTGVPNPKEYDVIIESTECYLCGKLTEGLSFVKGNYEILRDILLLGGSPKVLIKASYNYGNDYVETYHPYQIAMAVDNEHSTYVQVYVISYGAQVTLEIKEDNTIVCI